MAVTLLTVVAFATIMGGFLLTTQAADTTATTDANTLNTAAVTLDSNCSWLGFGGHGFGGGPMGAFGGCRGFGPVEVSSEFVQNVTNIAKSDADVITNVVDANGYVTTKATNATVILQKDSSGYASVLVNLEEGKVTRIIILTRTVIEKP
jgi:hypothetical protein